MFINQLNHLLFWLNFLFQIGLFLSAWKSRSGFIKTEATESTKSDYGINFCTLTTQFNQSLQLCLNESVDGSGRILEKILSNMHILLSCICM